MTLPTSQPLPPEENAHLSPARRRRSRRLIIPAGAGQRAQFLHDLSERVTPSADFFLYSVLCGFALSFAILLDAPALFILAALLAPFMAPVVGLSLAAIVGVAPPFLYSLGGIGIGSLLVFGFGSLVGWAGGQFWPGLPYHQAYLHAYFSWPDFVLLTLGAGLTAFLMIRSPQQKPVIPSVALAYELYLPVGIAGFGLTSGTGSLWPAGLIVFLIHLVWAALVGVIVMAVLGLRPLTVFGYAISITLAVLSLISAGAIATMSVKAPIPAFPEVFIEATLPAPTGAVLPTLIPSQTPPAPAGEVTITPTAPQATYTPTNTLVPSRTPTATVSPEPTLVWARIDAGEGGGALIRSEPSGGAKVVKSLLNGNLVQILPETTRVANTVWVRVRTADGVEGWVVRALLEVSAPAQTATPAPTR